MKDLSNKVVVITGGSRGLGKYYATYLQSMGAMVAIIDKSIGEHESSKNSGLLEVECDVTDYEKLQAGIAKIQNKFQRIDILINNASNYTAVVRRDFDEISSEEWRKTFDINVLGYFHCIKACVPFWKEQGGGKVINVTSDAPIKGLSHLLDYVCSKGAIISMTRALARELGEFNITVNAIAPGYVRHDDFIRWAEQRDAIVRARRCLVRTECPEDLVGVVAFLCSEASSFVTGQTIVVDGGEVFV